MDFRQVQLYISGHVNLTTSASLKLATTTICSTVHTQMTNVHPVDGLLSAFFSYHQKEKEPLMEDATTAIRYKHAAVPAVNWAHVMIKPS